MTRRLAAGRSARWAFMDRFEVPDYDSDGTYLTRWRLVQTPWFGVYLHRFELPDPRPTLHDHPWSFLSLLLRGGYIERRLDPHSMEVNEEHVVRWVNRVRASEAHAIVRLLRVPSWSLMVVGRRLRTWGYLEPVKPPELIVGRPHWRWTEFSEHRHAAEFDAAMARRAAS